jgi:hypothetical protein
MKSIVCPDFIAIFSVLIKVSGTYWELNKDLTQVQSFMPVIPGTLEVEIRKIVT